MRRIKPRLQKPSEDRFVVAERQIYPFEPHRWVFDAIQDKKRRLRSYKKRVNADEYWLALHSYEANADAWPLSKPDNLEKRELELLLLRFGAQPPLDFDRVIYAYPDGAVAELSGPDVPRVLHVQSALEGGYPAAVQHRLRIGFDVPLPGEFPTFLEEKDVAFKTGVVLPRDMHWKKLKPKARTIEVSVKLIVTHQESRLWMAFNSGPWRLLNVQTMTALVGKHLDLDLCFQGDIKDFDYNITVRD